MGYDLGGVEQVRCHVLFDPFGVGIDFPVCTVGYTHGYSHSGPFEAGPAKRRTIIKGVGPLVVPCQIGHFHPNQAAFTR